MAGHGRSDALMEPPSRVFPCITQKTPRHLIIASGFSGESNEDFVGRTVENRAEKPARSSAIECRGEMGKDERAPDAHPPRRRAANGQRRAEDSSEKPPDQIHPAQAARHLLASISQRRADCTRAPESGSR